MLCVHRLCVLTLSLSVFWLPLSPLSVSLCLCLCRNEGPIFFFSNEAFEPL